MSIRPTPLEASKALFIRRWGEMGGYWGISRTMAEIHALLFASNQPNCTDDVMSKLQISRGNASMNLRALVDWGLIQRVHLRGDRKEYFVCQTNVWQMFGTIIRQRRRREVEPIIDAIERCRDMVSQGASANSDNAEDAKAYLRRLEEMHQFLHVVGTIVDLMVKVGPQRIGRISGLMKQLTNTGGGRPRKTPRRDQKWFTSPKR